MPFQFVGKLGYVFDATLHQHYVRARWYEPNISRWLQPDPLGFIDGPNLYMYASGLPVLTVDPSGFAGCTHTYKPCGELTAIVGPGFEPDEYGSGMTVSWTRATRPCKTCCKEAGFVQMFTNVTHTEIPFIGRTLIVRDGGLDDRIPYSKKAPIGRIRVNPAGEGTLALEDFPGVPKKNKVGWPITLVIHKFETCVICLDRQPDLEDPGILYFGCFQWGHTQIYDTTKKTLSVSRYLNDLPPRMVPDPNSDLA